jgi:hypothetical protein
MRVLRTYWPIAISLAVSLIVTLIYGIHFGWTILPTDANEKAYSAFGQFGDYFGGILNPLLAFFNIALIVYYQKVSIAKSADKDVVFRMLELQSKIVASFELRTKHKHQAEPSDENEVEKKAEGEQSENEYEEVNSGLRSFWIFDKEIKTRYQRMRDFKKPGEPGPPERTPEQRLEILRKAYDRYYHGNFRKQYLGHYFRNLYLIFKTIDESEAFSKKEKLQYAKIVRAQMSHLEMKLLYLNCQIMDGAPFKKYVARYKLLEWISGADFSNFDLAFKRSETIKADISSWKSDS